MADSWASINGNALDWGAELQTHSIYDVLEAIRQAISERCTASGVTLSSPLNSAVTPLTAVKDYTDSIQSIITTLIPKFVNKSDNSGNWNGQTTIPNWTTTNIITDIGDSSRLSADQIDAMGLWLKQQFNILNRLVWIKTSLSFSYSGYSDLKTIRISSPTSWNDTVTAFNALNWGDVSGSFYAYTGHYAANNPGGSQAITRQRAKCSYSNPYNYAINCDNYFTFLADGTLVYDYNNNDYPNAIKNKLYCIETANISQSSSYDFWIGNLGNSTVADPSTINSGTQAGWSAFTSTPTTSLIVKFDGANGFKFKDYIVTNGGETVRNNGQTVTF